MSIFDINNIEIYSVIRLKTECGEGDTIEYNGCLRRYELIFCLDGEADVFFQGETVNESSGNVRFLPKEIKDNEYCVKNNRSGEYIDIFFDTKTPLPETFFVADHSRNERLRHLFIKLHSVWSSKEAGYYLKCLSLFFDILHQMQRNEKGAPPRSHRKRIEKGVEYIHAHFRDHDFDYKQPSLLCSVSYTYFKRLFREIYGVAPSEYVKGLRMSYACELLALGKFGIGQTAELCGYESIYYFSKVFKESIGVTPSEYRSSIS